MNKEYKVGIILADMPIVTAHLKDGNDWKLQHEIPLNEVPRRVCANEFHNYPLQMRLMAMWWEHTPAKTDSNTLLFWRWSAVTAFMMGQYDKYDDFIFVHTVGEEPDWYHAMQSLPGMDVGFKFTRDGGLEDLAMKGKRISMQLETISEHNALIGSVERQIFADIGYMEGIKKAIHVYSSMVTVNGKKGMALSRLGKMMMAGLHMSFINSLDESEVYRETVH